MFELKEQKKTNPVELALKKQKQKAEGKKKQKINFEIGCFINFVLYRLKIKVTAHGKIYLKQMDSRIDERINNKN